MGVKNRVMIWLLYVIYLSVLFYLLFFSAYRNDVQGMIAYNVIPFDSIQNYMNHYDGFRLSRLTDNVFGNIAAFVPFGFLSPILFHKLKISYVVTISFFFSLVIESSQILLRVGAFDVDDILLNTIGGGIGYLLLKLIFLFFNKRAR